MVAHDKRSEDGLLILEDGDADDGGRQIREAVSFRRIESCTNLGEGNVDGGDAVMDIPPPSPSACVPPPKSNGQSTK